MNENSVGLKQNLDFIRSTFNKAIFPAMLALLSANINVFVDGILVSNRLGSNALAAINMSLPVYLFLCIIGSFFASGTAINAARSIGDNDPEKSQMYYRTCVTTMFAVSIATTLLGLLFCDQIVSFVCGDGSIAPFVKEYVWITLMGALPKIMLYVPFWYLRLDGKNAAVALIMAVMSIGNIILDVLFVYNMDMGVFGAGLASVIATTAAFVIGMILLEKKNCFFSMKWFCFIDLKEWKIMASAGIPSALNNLLATIRLLIINSMLLSYGGGTEVAVFTAVNGIAGFAECITMGIPQASSPMLGVFSGEQDNGSSRILIKMELIVGVIYSAGFMAICLFLSKPIQNMYGLSEPMFMPLLWLSLSVFPGVVCTVIYSYYNMSGKNLWANVIIFSRIILMTYAGLVIVTRLKASTYMFLPFAELATIAVWLLLTGAYHQNNSNLSRLLQMDDSLERSGNVLNFSVGSDADEICSASERISEFCKNNGMDMKTTMRVELAMEEIMTLICRVNEARTAKDLSFDLRAYYLEGITGIRIRYGGIEFDPFREDSTDNNDMYMGIRMLRKMVRHMYQRTFGVNTLQVTLRKALEENE